MAGEHVSGVRFREGDRINGYEVLKTFDPGAFAFAAKAKSRDGRTVFFKKYKRPGAASAWYEGFVAYQQELKRRIQADGAAKSLCYEFIEFFEMEKPGGAVPLRAFYQVFEWVDGGTDLRGVLDKLKTNPKAFDWKQRVIFAKVMMAGINAIHKADIVHTDLKPENFYLIPEPAIAAKYKLRVIDLDFSLLAGKQAPWHGHEGYVGTPGYMSPEHSPEQVPGKHSDVFTCSLILGELLGGAHPSSENMDDYDDRARSGRLRAVKVIEAIPEIADMTFLEHVINSGLNPDFKRRPTAEQLLMALNGRLAEFDGRRPASLVASSAPAPAFISAAPKAEPTPSRTPSSAPLVISGDGGQTVPVSISTTLGRSHFKAWGTDFERFMSAEQFLLTRQPAGGWTIEHCSSAQNATTVDGVTLAGRMQVRHGMVVALGMSSRCPVTLNLSA